MPDGSQAAPGVADGAAAAGDPPHPAIPTWTAAAVARHLGVAPATLRSWSARYGIGPPDHQRGHYRRYSRTDIAELETAHRLHGDGMPMATAVSLARARHRPSEPAGTVGGRRGPSTAAEAADEVAALVRSARDLDSTGSVRILQDSLTRRGVVATWDELCRPALIDTELVDTELVGTELVGTADGAPADAPPSRTSERVDPAACVDAECVLVWAITTSLRRLPTMTPAPASSAGVLLACATGEQHSLGLDVLLAALDEHRIPGRTLGPSVPTPALVHAAELTRPAAIFVWSHTSATADPEVVAGLQDLAGRVIAAGPGWPVPALPAGIDSARSLDEALAFAQASRSRVAAGDADQ